MNSKKSIFLLLMFLLCSHTLVFSQNNETKIIKEKGNISRSNPYIPHSIHTNGYQGFSLGLSYPGFFSYYGQLNLYYNDSSNNSYFSGIGFAYLMIGANLNMVDFTSSKIYFNSSLGVVEKGVLGSFGFSYLIVNKDKAGKIEITLDAYFHQGKFYGDFLDVDTPYLRGIATNIYFNTKLSDRWFINYGIGVSFIQYRIMQRAYSDEYVYVTKHNEDTSKSLSNPKWDSKIIIPFGISLIYNI